jgi:hypothetical protein
MDEASGTVLHDTSTFATHGTIYAPTFGIASPVETDPSSLAMSGSVGKTLIADAPQADVRDNFSIEVFGYLLPPTQVSHLVTRNGQIGLSGGNWIAINPGGGGVRFTLSVSGTDYELTQEQAVANRWYHIVGTRNGNVMRLYVNGVLVATRTDVALGDISVGGSPAWFFGSAGNQDLFISAGIDEASICSPALNATEVKENYEAAINRLLSSATITVRVQLILDTDAPEPVDFAFAHNWTEPISGSERVITEHLSYRTHGNRSEPDYEQRVNARPHGPRRALEYAITLTSALARAAFQRTLFQPAQVFKLPIWTDWTPLTTTASISDTTLDCDTTLRDFEIGSYCTIASDPYDPSTFQFFRITSRTDPQLGISSSVTATVTNGLIAPARLAHLPNDESQLESYVIDRETGTLTFEILDTELSSRRITTYAPVSTYQPNVLKPAVEVFSLDSARFDILEQSQYAIRQRQLGTGNLTGNDYFRGLDTATSSTIPVRVLMVSRETLSEFYGWLEARQGRQNPVWVPTKENDLTFLASVSGTVLRIASGYAFYNLHYARRDIQITFTDGTVANRRITAVVDNGNGTENITLSSSVSANIAKISWLRFCVAPDSFELRFHRDITTPGNMIVECAWEFTELLTTP